VILAIAQDQPPSALPASAPKTEFSAARALEDVRAIAQKPHPTGTPENERARLYIVKELIKLGLEPRVHVTSITYADPRWGTPFPGATVQNIVAKLKGKTSAKKAVLLMAHYDSVPSGPGASDDGSGVATLLETARVLKASPQLANDVIFLITDAEELGLLGAK